MIYLATLLVFTYAISWVLYTKYQIIERRLPDNEEEVNLIPNTNWHKWKFVNQFAFFGMAALSVGPIDAIILSVFYWILFDALIAEVVLNKQYYYLGGTASIDKYFKGLISEKSFFYFRCIVGIALLVGRIILF